MLGRVEGGGQRRKANIVRGWSLDNHSMLQQIFNVTTKSQIKHNYKNIKDFEHFKICVLKDGEGRMCSKGRSRNLGE